MPMLSTLNSEPINWVLSVAWAGVLGVYFYRWLAKKDAVELSFVMLIALVTYQAIMRVLYFRDAISLDTIFEGMALVSALICTTFYMGIIRTWMDRRK